MTLSTKDKTSIQRIFNKLGKPHTLSEIKKFISAYIEINSLDPEGLSDCTIQIRAKARSIMKFMRYVCFEIGIEEQYGKMFRL